MVLNPRTCPRCGLLSPASATACECGAPLGAPGVETAAPQGIGGWLVLMAIGLVIQPFRLLGFLAQDLRAFEDNTWRRLTTPSSPAYHPVWGPVLVAETVANGLFLAGSFVLLYLFFKKRAAYPRIAIGFLAASAVFQVLEVAVGRALVGSGGLEKETGQLMLAVVSAALWISYLVRSRRVAATFVT